VNEVAQDPPHGDQDARNAKARREMARAAGVAMIGATSSLEEGAFVAEGVGPMGLVLLALAARGRRLLKSAYRLVDAGERAEAAPLLRVLHEYLIVSRWLLTDPEKHLPLWANDDLRKRDVVRGRVLADEEIGDEVKQAIRDEAEAEHEKVRALLAETAEEGQAPDAGEPCPTCGRPRRRQEGGLPPIEQMAARVGLRFAYDLAYRLQSQADVHATALVVDNTLIRHEDGSIMIRPEPDFGLSSYDSYQVGAHLLLDLLRPIDEQWPDLGWGPVLNAAAGSLDAIKKSDPAYRPRSRSEQGGGGDEA
jgi:hypothetical protein